MEAIRNVVSDSHLARIMDIPESFKKRRLEVIIIPLEEAANELELKRPGALQDYKSKDNTLVYHTNNGNITLTIGKKIGPRRTI